MHAMFCIKNKNKKTTKTTKTTANKPKKNVRRTDRQKINKK